MATIVAPKLTYQDLLEMPNDGKRYELVDGEVYMTPAPSTRHQEVVGRIYRAIQDFAESRDLGRAYIAPVDVLFDERTSLQPDVLFVRKNRFSIITPFNIAAAPDLVIEVLSSGTKRFDRETKFQVYARAGVSELWYVDAETNSMEILNLASPGQFNLTQHASGDEALHSAVLAGIPLTSRQVFA